MKHRHERMARARSCVLTFCGTSEGRFVLSCAAQSGHQRKDTGIVGRALELQLACNAKR
jgi:hypothetical protein